MHDRTARVFSGLGVLVLLWIGVYWAWPVRDDGATLPGVSLGDDTANSVGQDEPRARPPLVAERFPSPGSDEPQVFETIAPPEPDRPSVGSESGPAEPGARVIAPEFDDYVIRSGDNFEVISRRVYGTRRHAMAIARSNPLLDPRKLRAGQKIRVPRDPANIQGLPADGTGEPEGRPVPPSDAATIEYTVKRGDTLSGIAKAFYGSTKHVDFLYESNRGRLASKDDLRLGQVLLIRPLPEGAD